MMLKPQDQNLGQTAASSMAPSRDVGQTLDPIRVLRHYMVWLIASIFIGAAVGVLSMVVLRIVYPLYSSDVWFEVRPGLNAATDVGSQEFVDDRMVTRISNTQVFLLKRREILEDAVSDRSVRENTEWFQNSFIGQAGEPLIADAVDELEEDISTPVLRGTNIYGASWSAHTATDVPIVLNSIRTAYMAYVTRMNDRVYVENERVFDDQLRRTRLMLQDLGDEIRSFIRARGITTLDDARFSQAAIETEQLTQQMIESRSNLTMVNSALQQTAEKLAGTLDYTFEDIQMAEADITLREQLQLEEQLKAELRGSRERFRDDHPHVYQIEIRVRATEDQINSKRREIIERNLNSERLQYADQRDQLLGLIKQVEDDVDGKESELQDLAADQSSYEAMVTQRTHLELQRDADVHLINSLRLMRLREDAQRVRSLGDAETPRTLSFPRWGVMIPLGIILCFGLTLCIVFIRELTDRRIKRVSDLELLSPVRVIGSIPEIADDPTGPTVVERIVQTMPNSVIAEAYRQSYEPIARRVGQGGYGVISFVSGMPESGATTAISNIATIAKESGQSVVVVDANFRRPGLAKAMGVAEPRLGLGDVLAGDVSLDEVIVQNEGQVSVIAAGTPDNRVSNAFHGELFDRSVAVLRDRFDLVLIDVSPIIVSGDARVVANQCDGVIIVVRAYQEERGLVSRMLRELGESNSEIIGILLNRPRTAAGGYLKKNYAAIAGYSGRGKKEE